MKEYLSALVSPLLTKPEKLKVTQTTDEMGVFLTVSVSPDDMGRIIGKQGETAKAIRTMMKNFGYVHRQRISLKIEEPAGSTRPPYRDPEEREDF